MILLQQLTKRFGAQTAVDALSFEVPAGQILGAHEHLPKAHLRVSGPTGP